MRSILKMISWWQPEHLPNRYSTGKDHISYYRPCPVRFLISMKESARDGRQRKRLLHQIAVQASRLWQIYQYGRCARVLPPYHIIGYRRSSDFPQKNSDHCKLRGRATIPQNLFITARSAVEVGMDRSVYSSDRQADAILRIANAIGSQSFIKGKEYEGYAEGTELCFLQLIQSRYLPGAWTSNG